RDHAPLFDHFGEERSADRKIRRVGGVAAANANVLECLSAGCEQSEGRARRRQQRHHAIENEFEQLLHRPVFDELRGERRENAGALAAAVDLIDRFTQWEHETLRVRVAVDGNELWRRIGVRRIEDHLAVAEEDAVAWFDDGWLEDLRPVEQRAVNAAAIADAP